jgi:hypothetical protein
MGVFQLRNEQSWLETSPPCNPTRFSTTTVRLVRNRQLQPPHAARVFFSGAPSRFVLLLGLMLLCTPSTPVHGVDDVGLFDKDWCPGLCADFPLATNGGSGSHPCRNRFIFIVAGARTGSTTAMNMLNALPGMSMSGENNGAVYDLVQYWNHTMLDMRNRDGSRTAVNLLDAVRSNFDPTHRTPAQTNGPWRHEQVSTANALAHLQALFLETTGNNAHGNIYNKHARGQQQHHQHHQTQEQHQEQLLHQPHQQYAVGCKELAMRLGHVKETVLAASRLFPCSKFIWSVRENTTAWAKSLKELNFQLPWDKRNELMKAMGEAHSFLGPKRSYWLPLETFSNSDRFVPSPFAPTDPPSKVGAFDAVAHFLHYPNSCKFAKLFHSNSGKAGYGATRIVEEVLSHRSTCAAKLNARVGAKDTYFAATRADGSGGVLGGVGVDGVGSRPPGDRIIDPHCIPTCGNYYADAENMDGMSFHIHPEVSPIFRWNELTRKEDGYRRGPVEPYLFLNEALPGFTTVADASLAKLLRKLKKAHPASTIPIGSMDQTTAAQFDNASTKAFIFGSIESASHANAWTAPCQSTDQPVPMMPIFDPLIPGASEMTMISIEPLYKVHGTKLCSEQAVACSSTCWARVGAITGDAANQECKSCQQAMFKDSATMEMCFLKREIHQHTQSMAVPYPTNFVPHSDMDTYNHLQMLMQTNRDELMTYAASDHGTFSLFRAGLRAACKASAECTDYDCSKTVTCFETVKSTVGQKCSICSLPFVTQRHLRSKFSLQPPGDSPTRQSIFDSLILGCIPVFFSTCARPDLMYETMYDPFLPRYNRTRFGAGLWAVVLNATAAMLDPLYVERELLEVVTAKKDSKGVKPFHRMQATIREFIPQLLYPKRMEHTTVECVQKYKYGNYMYIDQLRERGIVDMDTLTSANTFWAAAYLKQLNDGPASGVVSCKNGTLLLQFKDAVSVSGKQTAVVHKPKYKSYRHKLQVLAAEEEAAKAAAKAAVEATETKG